MTTLHCCYEVLDASAALRLEQQAVAGDAVVLLGQAVCAAAAQLEALGQRGLGLYMLRPDLELYGVKTPHSSVTVIDHAGWVDLAVAFDTQQLWR